MSITNGDQEPARSEPEQSTSFTPSEIQQYLHSLGLPLGFGEKLKHLACTSHEDVSGGPVMPLQETAVVADGASGARESSVPPVDPRIPPRLHPVVPPINFGAVVEQSIYRSGYPQPENFGFLKSLKLKSILTLVPEPISPEYSRFMDEHNIQHFRVHIPANKGQVKIGACEMTQALKIVLDRSNHPLLIHCNKGKHRTGCVVGCFRRVQGDESSLVFDEYHTYADPKARLFDEACIELFNEDTVLWMAQKYGWLQPTIDQSTPPSPVSMLSSVHMPV
ncbi:tyrosine phosphatase family-domain-containing protein [Dendryphion nanum]|uniref:diphosphoinositol-polyphosphate diphosphatase n=1 Tax=Dendryphion nanum TaxID=256645 RepID=A0A9P9IN83_9PLEO|nr:tyrosine phosphatase family-domain-containing protein [Dendryphion nanum]